MSVALTCAYPAMAQRHCNNTRLALIRVSHSTFALDPNEAYHSDKALHTAAKDSRVSSLAKRYPLPFAIVLPPPPPSLLHLLLRFVSHTDSCNWLAGNIWLQIRFVMFPLQLLRAQKKKYEIILRIRLRRAINNFTAVYGQASPTPHHTNKGKFNSYP